MVGCGIGGIEYGMVVGVGMVGCNLFHMLGGRKVFLLV